MFSPYYSLARRFGRGDPAHHCCMHVALYGKGVRRWAMTERGRKDLRRDARTLTIGRSTMDWDGTTLVIRFDENTAPFPGRVRGTVRVHPSAIVPNVYPLDTAGLHRWQPMAPVSRVEATIEQPGIAWSGAGYLDTNDGDGPMEDVFARWDWSCARTGDGASLLYDVTPRDGERQCLAMQIDRQARVTMIEAPPIVSLPMTSWRIARQTRGSGPVRVVETVLDAPFYARSVLSVGDGAGAVMAMHETLSLDRFRSPLVHAMLPFKMPRERA